MAPMPAESHLQWAANAVGTDTQIRAVEGLHDGSSPWRLVIDAGTATHEVILRVAGWIPPHAIVTGAMALRITQDHQLAAPRLIAADLDGRATGRPAAVETALPGGGLPRIAANHLLQSAGAMIARVHAVHLAPTTELPLRVRPVDGDDYAMERRWANLYRASEPEEKPAVVRALSQLTDWPIEHAERAVEGTVSSPLMQLAEDRLLAVDRPSGQTVFLHGDLHGGNMLWDEHSCVALIDWKSAGVGDPGLDLGRLRMNMAIRYGHDAAEQVLRGWEAETGHPAANLPYWDAVSALNTPTVLWPGLPAFNGEGRNVDPTEPTERRNHFLRTALDQLEPSSRIPRHSRYV